MERQGIRVGIRTRSLDTHVDMNIEILDKLTDIERWGDRWNELARETPGCLPMSTYAWFASYVENCLPPSDRYLCVIASEGDELAGVLPAILSTGGIPGIRYTRAALPFDDHTFSVEALVRPSHEDCVTSMLDHLKEAVPGPVVVVFKRLREHSAVNRVRDKLAPSWITALEFEGYGSYLPTAGSFDEIEQRLSRNFRRNLVKAGNKLDRLSSVHFEFIQDADRNEEFLQKFLALERAGWKGTSGTAIQADDKLTNFYRAVANRLAKANMIQWQVLSGDDKVLAINFAARLGRVISEIKIAYDEDYRKCMPGGKLLEHVLTRACENSDIAGIDLLTDMDWHDNWKPQKRQFYNHYLHSKDVAAIIGSYLPLRAKVGLKRIPGLAKTYRWIRRSRQS